MDTSTRSDNVESSDNTATPTKPSLRILDGSANATTLQEDLTNGPLLLGLGSRQGSPEHDMSGLPSDLESELPERHHVNENSPYTLPFRLSGPPSAQTLTESEPSLSGPSYSVPTTSLPCESVAYHEMSPPPLPRRFEFSWENSGLCFAGDPLHIVKVLKNPYSEANPATELAFLTSRELFFGPQVLLSGTSDHDSLVAGIGGFYGSEDSWSTVTLPQDLELAYMRAPASSTSSKPDTIMKDNLTEQTLDPMVHIAIRKKIEWVAHELVDDFLRSYAPQEKRKRTATTEENYTDNSPTTKSGANQKSGEGSQVRHETHKRKKIGNNEGSEDEEPGPSSKTKSEDSLYFACPFIKWRPLRYKNCTRRYKLVNKVRAHVRKDHMQTYCPTCSKIFADKFIPIHTCEKNLPPHDHIITKEMHLQLEKPKSKNLTQEEEWHRVYNILFPNEPPCLNPYVDEETARKQGIVEQYFYQPKAQAIIHREFREGFGNHISKQIIDVLYNHILPLLEEGFSLDKDEDESAQSEEYGTANAQPGHATDFDTLTSIPCDISNSMPYQLEKEYSTAQLCTILESAGLLMPESSATQEQNVFTSGDTVRSQESGYSPGISGFVSNGLGGDYTCQMSVNEENYSDIFWSEAYEVRSDLMSTP
ncbi:hypothetical protein FHETE_8109 [Fusarium heterosporum]|uniref:C2H2-type domain-containing protein n=1 Tax=Fusarium heterosporum TaxID=42747 RepID=A0A8H5T456_FUSHE|nr:hypothetical protein FHETE_8109 [Fusarium heterosporum]